MATVAISVDEQGQWVGDEVGGDKLWAADSARELREAIRATYPAGVDLDVSHIFQANARRLIEDAQRSEGVVRRQLVSTAQDTLVTKRISGDDIAVIVEGF